MNNPIRFPGLSLLSASFAVLAMSALSAQAATELAKINNTVITLEEFNKRYSDNLKLLQQKAPSKRAVLDDLVKRELGVQEAKRMGLDKDADVQERINTVLYQALVEKRLAKEFDGISVSDSEAKEFYNKNPELRTSHIFIAAPATASDQDVQEAQKSINKIYNEHVKAEKISFAEIAQRYSEGPSAPMGGDLDYQTKDRLDPLYYRTALDLKTPGKISKPIRSQYGFHIIKLTAIRPLIEADRVNTKRMLVEEKRTQIFDRFMNQLKGQARVSIKSDLIKE